jgi:hypothetical protein
MAIGGLLGNGMFGAGNFSARLAEVGWARLRNRVWGIQGLVKLIG